MTDNNEPVAWMTKLYSPDIGEWWDWSDREKEGYTPLYTHPVKEDAQYDRGFDDGCKHAKKIYEAEIEALKTHPAKLTDEELDSIIASVTYPRTHAMDKHMIKLALKKASEK